MGRDERLLEMIARDCFARNKRKTECSPKYFSGNEFTTEENEKYCKFMDGEFWGGCSHLEEVDDLLLCCIRLDSPWGDSVFYLENPTSGHLCK